VPNTVNMNKKIKLQNSESSFKQGVLMGFIISFGLIFFAYPIEDTVWGIVFQFTIGTSFMGIIFSVLVMCVTSILLSAFTQTLDVKFNREELFNLLMRTHLPLFLGVVIGIAGIFNFQISKPITFWMLEVISLAFLFNELRIKEVV